MSAHGVSGQWPGNLAIEPDGHCHAPLAPQMGLCFSNSLQQRIGLEASSRHETCPSPLLLATSKPSLALLPFPQAAMSTRARNPIHFCVFIFMASGR